MTSHRFRSFEQRWAEAVEHTTTAIEQLLAQPPDERNPHIAAMELMRTLHRDGWRPNVAPYDEPPPRSQVTPAKPERVAALLADFRQNDPRNQTDD